MKKLIVASLMIVGASQVAMAKYSTTSIITGIYAYKSGAVVVLKNQSVSTGCKLKRYFAIDDLEKSKGIYSTILTAYTTNQKVRLGFSGCSTIWSSAESMPSMYSAMLTK